MSYKTIYIGLFDLYVILEQYTDFDLKSKLFHDSVAWNPNFSILTNVLDEGQYNSYHAKLYCSLLFSVW